MAWSPYKAGPPPLAGPGQVQNRNSKVSATLQQQQRVGLKTGSPQWRFLTAHAKKFDLSPPGGGNDSPGLGVGVGASWGVIFVSITISQLHVWRSSSNGWVSLGWRIDRNWFQTDYERWFFCCGGWCPPGLGPGRGATLWEGSVTDWLECGMACGGLRWRKKKQTSDDNVRNKWFWHLNRLLEIVRRSSPTAWVDDRGKLDSSWM